MVARRPLVLFATLLFAAPIIACTVDPPAELDGGPGDAGDAAAEVDAAPEDGGFTCSPGRAGCYGSTHYRCGEDGLTREDEVECADACTPERGCVTCVPGTRSCDGTVSRVCDDDASGWSFGRDCADWGVACGDEGFCEDACAVAEAQRSYVGCEYFASPLANYEGDTSFDPAVFDFRVVVANPNSVPTEVTITHGDRFLRRETIVPGGVAEISLPWVDGLSFPFDGGPWTSLVRAEGAYRLISSRPVIVAQFNPFQYASAGEYSHTNDASLLLPVHALGSEYVGLSYPPLSSGRAPDSRSGYPGYLALIGVTPEPASIEIVPTAAVAADEGGRWPATAAGEPVRITLARGEVALITPQVPPLCDVSREGFSPVTPGSPENGGYCFEPDYDLTGSRVRSDRPIEAFGGHACAFVPFDVAACDHLETTLAPIATWGSEIETMPLRDPATDVPNLLRIVAGHDGTEITVDPPHPDVPAGFALDAGELVDLMIDGAISIRTSKPVQVGQLMLGQNLRTPPLPRGDPGLTTLVPHEQFRRDYVFVTPSSYVPTVNGQSWVLASREPGVAIMLDGAPIEAEWISIGGRELGVVPVTGGAHRATSSAPFGLIAYGLGSYTSYAYPAGLDLRIVPF